MNSKSEQCAIQPTTSLADEVAELLEIASSHPAFAFWCEQTRNGVHPAILEPHLRRLAAAIKELADGSARDQGKKFFCETFDASHLSAEWREDVFGAAKMFCDTFKNWKRDGTFCLEGADAPGGNLADWARNQRVHRRRSSLLALSASASTLPTIVTGGRQLCDVIDDARRALVNGNTPPTVFRQGERLVRLGEAIDDVILKDYAVADLTEELARRAEWMAPVRECLSPAFPPERVVNAILARPPPDIPALDVICTAPFFTSKGDLVITDGYCRDAKAYVVLDPVLKGLSVPPVPSADEVAAAVVLLKEMVCDVKWAHGGDEAHYFGLIFEPFVRPMIDGTCPLHCIEAPEVGSGKSLVVDACALIATGRAMPNRPFPQQEEEREKVIFTLLRDGKPFVAFDNVQGAVESPALEAALTSSIYSGRILGRSETQSAPNRASWTATFNNGTVSPDLARRSVRSRIDTGLEKPAERDSKRFRHPELRCWVKDNRGQLVRAVLTLVQNWISKGRLPYSGRRLASFESWSEVVGGILESARLCDGFLDAATQMTPDDTRKDEAVEFLEAWCERFGDREVRAKDLLEMAAPDEDDGKKCQVAPYLTTVLAVHPAKRSARIGSWLQKNKDRVQGGYKIVLGTYDAHGKANRYKLLNVNLNSRSSDTPTDTQKVVSIDSKKVQRGHDVLVPVADSKAPALEKGAPHNI